MSEIKTVRSRSGEGAVRSTMSLLPQSSSHNKIANCCYECVTRERIFAYKKATCTWNIAWNSSNVILCSFRASIGRVGKPIAQAPRHQRYRALLDSPLAVD